MVCSPSAAFNVVPGSHLRCLSDLQPSPPPSKGHYPHLPAAIFDPLPRGFYGPCYMRPLSKCSGLYNFLCKGPIRELACCGL